MGNSVKQSDVGRSIDVLKCLQDATYYSVYVVSGAVGIVNLETDRAELSGRSQEDLAS